MSIGLIAAQDDIPANLSGGLPDGFNHNSLDLVKFFRGTTENGEIQKAKIEKVTDPMG
jgi:hypothetical protein